MPNWTLNGCCSDTEEIVFIVLYVVYSVLTMFFMEKAIGKPVFVEPIRFHSSSIFLSNPSRN
jgi:hypothetical protein